MEARDGEPCRAGTDGRSAFVNEHGAQAGWPNSKTLEPRSSWAGFPLPCEQSRGRGDLQTPPIGLVWKPETEPRPGQRTAEGRPSNDGGPAGWLPSLSPLGRGGNQESEGHPGQRVSERERPRRAGTDGVSRPPWSPGSVEWSPSWSRAPPLLPAFEISSRGFVQLFPARMYESRADGSSGREAASVDARARRLSRAWVVPPPAGSLINNTDLR